MEQKGPDENTAKTGAESKKKPTSHTAVVPQLHFFSINFLLRQEGTGDVKRRGSERIDEWMNGKDGRMDG